MDICLHVLFLRFPRSIQWATVGNRMLTKMDAFLIHLSSYVHVPLVSKDTQTGMLEYAHYEYSHLLISGCSFLPYFWNTF